MMITSGSINATAAAKAVSPGHVPDFHRFLTGATATFQHDQVVILRAVNPDWFIFHHLGNLADEFDRLGGHGAIQALQLDICRANSGNFIVPEQASGFGFRPGFSTAGYSVRRH